MRDGIYCKRTDGGFHTFYLVTGGQEYYLFRQRCYRGVQEYYGGGTPVDTAFDFSRAHRDDAIERTMAKLPKYIRYVEKEYAIHILEQSKRRRDRSCAAPRAKCA